MSVLSVLKTIIGKAGRRPTCGLYMWPGLPHNIVAEFQGQVSWEKSEQAETEHIIFYNLGLKVLCFFHCVLLINNWTVSKGEDIRRALWPESGSVAEKRGSKKLATGSGSKLVFYKGWFPLGLTGLISVLSKGTLKSFLQHHCSKASILWCSYLPKSSFPALISIHERQRACSTFLCIPLCWALWKLIQ